VVMVQMVPVEAAWVDRIAAEMADRKVIRHGRNATVRAPNMEELLYSATKSWGIWGTSQGVSRT
jgi:hypothetical protein